MTRKKTTYEKKGLVRQIAGSLFAPAGLKEKIEDSKWRQRKTLFEKLDGADDEEDFELESVTNSGFSVQSENTDYMYGNHVENKKASAHRKRNSPKHQQKPELRSIVIKPSTKDMFNSRMVSTRTRETKNEHVSHVNDHFSPDPFENVFNHRAATKTSNGSIGKGEKSTGSTQSTVFDTVESDTTKDFAWKPLKLTRKNLEMAATTPSEPNTAFGIENVNPRTEFLQFTIDEDKESTVIESVLFGGDDEGDIEMKPDDNVGEEDLYHVGFTNDVAFGPSLVATFPWQPSNRHRPDSNDDFFPVFNEIEHSQHRQNLDSSSPVLRIDEPKETDRDSDVMSTQFVPSTHSLAYSASSCGEANILQRPENVQRLMKKIEERRNDHRSPLSPLNVFHHSKSDGRPTYKLNSNPDPEACWADFSESAFEKKPDPKGSNAQALISSNNLFAIDQWPENNENAKAKHLQPKRIESRAMYPLKPSKNVWGQRAIPEDQPVEIDDDSAVEGSEIHYEYGYMTRRPSEEIDCPIGIQRFPTSTIGSSSGRSHCSSSIRSTTHSNTFNEIDSYNTPSYHQSTHYSTRTETQSQSSFSKPLGIPNNAIMASMLFRRHHNIDTEVVEAKLKEHEQAHKVDRSRGDIPQSVQAIDGVSCISSFSEDTAAKLDMWTKPTRDLLDHFSHSRRTNTDFKSRLREQRAQATELYEA